jgi:hypothetical protein
MARSSGSQWSATQDKPAKSPASAGNKADMIRKVAQDLYVKKGRQSGHDLENWLEAERLVNSGKV